MSLLIEKNGCLNIETNDLNVVPSDYDFSNTDNYDDDDDDDFVLSSGVKTSEKEAGAEPNNIVNENMSREFREAVSPKKSSEKDTPASSISL